ncbi:hypothetical protein [Phenylobacterium sp.]|uniref:hypothetical protein n=1 Tax=Phenylobacterium sp. TaxID=1871053 RepID=UPI0025E037D3|nr:hypothetical protein [Phenylobacterium sp.]
MGKFRKKPVVIDAVRFTNAVAREGWRTADLQQNHWLHEACREGILVICKSAVQGRSTPPPFILIRTLEGELSGLPGDWIIRGVKGELYACKPDIFAATYEPA